MRGLVLIILMLLFSTAAADTFVGAGFYTRIPGPDRNENKVLNISARWEQDTDHPWFVAANYGGEYLMYKRVIDKHAMVIVGKQLLDYEYFYFDFGLAATSNLNPATSSRVLFYEGMGVKYNNFRIGVAHWSNAGITPPNEGETILNVEYKVSF